MDNHKARSAHYFNLLALIPSTKNATHLSKVAVEAALGLRPQLDIYGSEYPMPDGTYILRTGDALVTLNCGYGHGFSVREVIEMVKRVSDVAFKVESAPRRPGDPAQIVAACDRARAKLGWVPQYDHLAIIIAHALAWEQSLRDR